MNNRDNSNFGDEVNFCYCDESGMGEELIAVMVGVVVNSSRMHLTKSDWQVLLDALSELVGKPLSELHTKDFYRGSGPYRKLTGERRSAIISLVFNWLKERRHHVVYTSLIKEEYVESLKRGDIPNELNTVWRFLGFHLVLAMQKYCQKQDKNKGHTLYVFDNKEQEERRFLDMISKPPKWSDQYYNRKPKQNQLDQIVDVPYFVNSQDVGLIQLADFFSYFLRRHAEISEGFVEPKYEEESKKLSQWLKVFAERKIKGSPIYPRTSRNSAQDLFFRLAPKSIRNL